MEQGTITVHTSARIEMIDITAQINQAVSKSGLRQGVCYLYNPHTTSALTINEGADPDVQGDITAAIRRIVPEDFPYKHLEGNSPAHIMTSLFGSSETIFIDNGSLQLGTWQRVFFCEFDGPRSRKVHWRLLPA